jgi:hypothetical protein
VLARAITDILKFGARGKGEKQKEGLIEEISKLGPRQGLRNGLAVVGDICEQEWC